MTGNVTGMASDKRHFRKLCQSVPRLCLAAAPLYLPLGGCRSFGSIPTATGGFPALLDQQPALAQLAVMSPETRAALLTLHSLKERDVTILSMRQRRKRAIKQQNSGDKCCWEGYSLSIPARDFLQGILFLSFLLPEQTGLGKDLTGCPEMLDMAR